MTEINPLFAIEAEQLLLDNKIEESINLCNQGLVEYPDYITAWGILVKAFIKKGDWKNAQITLDKTLNDFPENIFLISLKNQILAESNSENAEKNLTPNEIDNENKQKPSDNIQTDLIDIEQESNNIQKKDEATNETSLIIEQNETINTVSSDIQIDEKVESEDDIGEDNFGKDDIKEIEVDIAKENESKADEIDEDLQTTENNQNQIDESGIIEKSLRNFTNALLIENKDVSLNKLSNKFDIIPGLDEIDFINENILSIERNSFKLFTDIPYFPNINFNIHEQLENTDDLINVINDDLTSLAAQLETATLPKITEKSNKEEKSDDASLIVSETMAKIYTQQGAYEQAAQAYQKLIKQNPEKKEYFTSKLNDIISKL